MLLTEAIRRVEKEIDRTESQPAPESKVIGFARRDRLIFLRGLLADYSAQKASGVTEI